MQLVRQTQNVYRRWHSWYCGDRASYPVPVGAYLAGTPAWPFIDSVQNGPVGTLAISYQAGDILPCALLLSLFFARRSCWASPAFEALGHAGIVLRYAFSGTARMAERHIEFACQRNRRDRREGGLSACGYVAMHEAVRGAMRKRGLQRAKAGVAATPTSGLTAFAVRKG